ncbi:hypothetical protein FIBSPDRAFT_65336 [Athelia psychrophila]|uniref:Uncharacterized protein n=1 Tax=Athelia psychrophila TaxID=1759441 RepID=A0A166EWB1_9AGAM|nr:hypothetical protein FIBSPDRAFT_65336 [Fibularhizoctonia sp. CBS 109695]
MFFISSLDDKTVKVRDTAGRSGMSQVSRGITILEDVRCFATAADDGNLHVVKVHWSQRHPPKYNKLQVIREHQVEHLESTSLVCCTHHADQASNLIYTTTYSTNTLIREDELGMWRGEPWLVGWCMRLICPCYSYWRPVYVLRSPSPLRDLSLSLLVGQFIGPNSSRVYTLLL